VIRGRAAAAVMLFVALVPLAACTGSTAPESPAQMLAADKRTFSSEDPVARGCALSKEILLRIWRGHDPKRSEDITMVPQYPNYSGTFVVPNHSGPWKYLQQVPLVLYGPGRVAEQGQVQDPASVVDIYPTVAQLMGASVAPRGGRVLSSALTGAAGVPKLVMVIVWDGAGRDMLDRWPDAWPNLARLERQGTSYVNATIGSSPSITPATHSSIGTGVYPHVHGVVGIKYRASNGKVANAFSGRTTAIERVTTFSDQIDQDYGNAPKVGMMAWRSWHMGMFSHGSEIPGGDHDQLALIGHGKITGNPTYYSMPSYLEHFPGLKKEGAKLDRADGKVDGKWMGHDILSTHDNPAWVNYEADAELAMLKREGYGLDDVPDIFMTNFKMTDIVGHVFGMDQPEEQGVLHAQDVALGRILDYLNKKVKDYAVILTADHGHTPSPKLTGGWPIANGEIKRDIDTHFHVPSGESLSDDTSAVGVFLNYAEMKKLNISEDEIARFLNGYTLRENWPQKQLPAGYEDRGDEDLFSAVFAKDQFDDVMRCAFGATRPPKGMGDIVPSPSPSATPSAAY
jgi:predicted AlkP superfamily pyrophosphatase or phosphodiesterase